MKPAESARLLAILKSLGAETPELPPEAPLEPTYPGAAPAAAPEGAPSAALSRLAKRKPRQPNAGTGLVDAGQPALGAGAPAGLSLGPATQPVPGKA